MSPRTIETILRIGEVKEMHLVVANPSWPDFHPTDCPQPIVDWMNANAPGAIVERVTGLIDLTGYVIDPDVLEWLTKEIDPSPVFWLNMKPEEARQLIEDWNKLHPETVGRAKDIYHIELFVPSLPPAGMPIWLTEVPADSPEMVSAG